VALALAGGVGHTLGEALHEGLRGRVAEGEALGFGGALGGEVKQPVLAESYGPLGQQARPGREGLAERVPGRGSSQREAQREGEASGFGMRPWAMDCCSAVVVARRSRASAPGATSTGPRLASPPSLRQRRSYRPGGSRSRARTARRSPGAPLSLG
jgi:hypothetical protein